MPVRQVCADSGGNATVRPSTTWTSATRGSCLVTRMFTRSGTEKLGGLVIIWTEEDEANKLNQPDHVRITYLWSGHVAGGSPGWLSDRWVGLQYLHHTTAASLSVCALQSLQPLCRLNRLTSLRFVFVWSPGKAEVTLTSLQMTVFNFLLVICLFFCGQRKFKQLCLHVFSIERLWQPFISSVHCCGVYSEYNWVIAPWYLYGFSQDEAVRRRLDSYDCCSKTHLFSGGHFLTQPWFCCHCGSSSLQREDRKLWSVLNALQIVSAQST